MNFFSAEGLYSDNGLIESFKQDSSIKFNLKPAFREFSKDISKALGKMDYSSFKSKDFISVSDITKQKDEKSLELRDKKENPFFVNVNNKNQICVTKNNQTLCFADKDFKSAGPSISESKLKTQMDKSRLKVSSLKGREIKRSSPKKASPKKSKKLSPKKSSPKKKSKKSSKERKNISKLNKAIRKSLPTETSEERSD